MALQIRRKEKNERLIGSSIDARQNKRLEGVMWSLGSYLGSTGGADQLAGDERSCVSVRVMI